MSERIYTNIFTINHINKIGGVESWLYYIAKKYSDRDITIFYGVGDPDQIERLRKYVRVVKYDGEKKIKCKRAFFNYSMMGIDNIEAEEYIYVIHADYRLQNITPELHPKLNRFIAVSKTAQESFKAIFGVDVELMYNPLVVETPRKVLRLISATRLSSEKGYPRMVKLAEALKNADIPYTWDVYTYDDVKTELFNKCKPRLDIMDIIADHDYLVQLSSSEASCYAIREALMLKVPCIATNIETFRENGVVNGKTGWLLPLDMHNIPVQEIYKGLPPFEYKDFPDKYGALLGKNKSTYKRTENPSVKVKAIQTYRDIELNRILALGETAEMPYKRAVYLESRGFVELIEDEI
ncbi:MAG: hypothetical protein IKO45_04930 [Clostridia bacterium]|nr:hypothetical protein [Clostridia bacterium]MBR4623878.1 hypothetical protein [Clostridia bacterium]